ncbi:bacterio-opsin activator domain-containing protein [Halorussus amylolyticus]|uniref:bacterio-opsin activator domain-containing protein n=1 Tax=Halorussus amylolyticus TaxID=1126242 RepID=UPI0010429F6B|nr:bacterio-opsin activator domain-containing protein [Halorussus amylolyticus]
MTLDSPRNAVRVLYVDSDPPPDELPDERLNVTAASSAAAARDHLADASGVDCVVSEYDLPESDGITLLETVRDDYPNLPFVVFTGSGSESVASEAVGKGASDYLPKSAGLDSLRDRVRRAVATNSVESDSGLTGDRMRELTNAFPDVAFIIDETGRYLEVLSGPRTANLKTVEQERLVGRTLHDAFETSKADRFLDLIETTLETGSVETLEYRVETDAGTRWFESRTAPLGTDIDDRGAVVWVARDVTDRLTNERRLAARSDELETLTRINGLINRIFQSLVESASREEIERTVCEGLANSEFYQFAWIGGPWVKDERMTPGVISGADPEAVERLVEATSARPNSENSFADVVTEGESVVVRDVPESPQLSEAEREQMLELGMPSAVLVPLSYGNTNYGVLGISGACTDTFGDRELTALETLGVVVAFAINAVKNRNLLFSDTAVELELRVPQSKSVFGQLSATLGCECTLEGFVPIADDRLLEYVTVEGDASTVGDLLTDAPRVEEHRIVSEGEACLVEVVLSESGVAELIKAGTMVKSATANGGTVRLAAEAPSDVGVRSVIDSFRLAYPDSELVSKQEVNHPVRTAREFRQTLTEKLTDKQRTALKAAYFAGYYDYPRGSTAEEIADSLDISSPTLHQHLRAAQGKLVGTFLD